MCPIRTAVHLFSWISHTLIWRKEKTKEIAQSLRNKTNCNMRENYLDIIPPNRFHYYFFPQSCVTYKALKLVLNPDKLISTFWNPSKQKQSTIGLENWNELKPLTVWSPEAVKIWVPSCKNIHCISITKMIKLPTWFWVCYVSAIFTTTRIASTFIIP